jgi:hypothetical protein
VLADGLGERVGCGVAGGEIVSSYFAYGKETTPCPAEFCAVSVHSAELSHSLYIGVGNLQFLEWFSGYSSFSSLAIGSVQNRIGLIARL